LKSYPVVKNYKFVKILHLVMSKLILDSYHICLHQTFDRTKTV